MDKTRAQHTPGPWYYTGSSPEGSVYSADHELIVPWSSLLSDRKMANARLIAAAPRMLDLIQRIAKGQWNGPDNQIEARAILRDVEGWMVIICRLCWYWNSPMAKCCEHCGADFKVWGE